MERFSKLFIFAILLCVVMALFGFSSLFSEYVDVYALLSWYDVDIALIVVLLLLAILLLNKLTSSDFRRDT